MYVSLRSFLRNNFFSYFSSSYAYVFATCFFHLNITRRFSCRQLSLYMGLSMTTANRCHCNSATSVRVTLALLTLPSSRVIHVCVAERFHHLVGTEAQDCFSEGHTAFEGFLYTNCLLRRVWELSCGHLWPRHLLPRVFDSTMVDKSEPVWSPRTGQRLVLHQQWTLGQWLTVGEGWSLG